MRGWGAGGPSAALTLPFPITFWGVDSESRPLPPPICAASPEMTETPGPPPRPPYTVSGVQAFRRRLTHPELHTANYTELYTVCTPHYTQFHRVSPTVSAPASSPAVTHATSCMHTPPPPTRRSHTRDHSQAHLLAPHPTEVYTGGTRAHTRTHTHRHIHSRSVIILDMPFLLHDSSSGDAQSCHLDEK